MVAAGRLGLEGSRSTPNRHRISHRRRRSRLARRVDRATVTRSSRPSDAPAGAPPGVPSAPAGARRRFPPASKSGLLAAFIFLLGDPRLYKPRRASLEPSDYESGGQEFESLRGAPTISEAYRHFGLGRAINAIARVHVQVHDCVGARTRSYRNWLRSPGLVKLGAALLFLQCASGPVAASDVSESAAAVGR